MRISWKKEPVSDAIVYDRQDFPSHAVIAAIASQVWLLLMFLGALLAASLVWFFKSGDSMPAKMTLWFFKMAIVGLIGSFALHELAHAMMLKRIEAVTHIAIDRTAWRISIVPRGTMTARQVVNVAIIGPVSCVAVGSALWISNLDISLAWWYLAHGIFLLPFFGDGRNFYNGLRGHGGSSFGQ